MEQSVKSIMFVGAGATASLGLTTTYGLGKFITDIRGQNWDTALRGDCRNSRHRFVTLWELFLRKRLPKNEVEQELRDLYNAEALIELLDKVPQKSILQPVDVYNLIDMHIELQHGIKTGHKVISLESLYQARRLLDVLITYRHSLDYQLMLENHQGNYIQYQKFAEFLAVKMQEEGVQRYHETRLKDKEFYLFSYSIISMNWDPLFLWLLFNAHKELNEQAPFVGNPASPLKLYHDFAHPMHMRKITTKAKDDSIWFPMNEGAAYRLNDTKYQTGKRVRLGKFYFPHGSHAFRECQNCGKLNVFLGDEWSYHSKTLFQPNIFNSNLQYRPFSKREEIARKERRDAMSCVHCAELTYSHDTAIVMQTNFKGNHPAYIEEIQRDMKVSIEQAEHIILFGYSLPTDDFVYHSILAAKRGENAKVSIVGGGSEKDLGYQWIYGEEIERCFQKSDGVYQTYEGIKELFGKENIRVYTGRIPDVFQENDEFNEMKANKLFVF